MQSPYLIAGLGNPGEKYALTRHNLGFMVVIAFAKKQNWPFKRHWRVKGKIAEGVYQKKRVILLLPALYMNLSGRPVRQSISYFKVDVQHFLVVADEAHLDFGTVRLRAEGSFGGHKGLKNIEEELNTQKYARLKLGIKGNDEQSISLEHYVLAAFTLEQQKALPHFVEKGVLVLEKWLDEGTQSAMEFAGALNKINSV